jgi:MerR family transcriptional regulator, mercuric resistance operon regulatory protein
MNNHTIGGIATLAGVHKETIRYYQQLGLVPQPARAAGSVRRYGEDTVSRLLFIKRAQELGFTLAEIKRLLSLENPRECSAAREIANEKLELVRSRIRDLNRMKRTLESLVDQCNSGGRHACPIIETLSRER